MIDWITAIIPYQHRPLNGGNLIKIDPNGEQEWNAPCRIKVRGSHESSIHVRSWGGDGTGVATELYIDGNPSKYLQGHNVFGSNDLIDLVLHTVFKALPQIGLEITQSLIETLWSGNYSLNRVDVNESFELPSLADVKSWLRSAEIMSRSRHGRPSSKAGTVYWGKNSRRHSFKAYSKYEEITSRSKNHRLALQFLKTPIQEWAENKLRLELTLRRKELEETNYRLAKTWRGDTPIKLFNEYLKRIEMNEQIMIPNENIEKLPSKVVMTYIAWKSGCDIRANMKSATFYRHRKILRDHGIDINIAVNPEDQSNVIPLIRVLEAKPVGVPDWAHQLRLVHGSSHIRQVVNN